MIKCYPFMFISFKFRSHSINSALIKMAKILNQHLDELVCCQCKKYLSVFPVKVYAENVVKCGRCCVEDDGGVVSLYQTLADQCLFKCSNRYEGCRAVLLPSEMVEHEKICKERTRKKCPCCETSAEMSTFQLVQHFKQHHNDRYLSSNIFYVTFLINPTDKIFLYVQNNTIFFIIVLIRGDDLYVNAEILYSIKNITQRFIISIDTLSIKEETTKRNCGSLATFNSYNYYKINVNNILNRLVKFELILDASYEMEFSEQLTSQVQALAEPKVDSNQINENTLNVNKSEERINRVQLTPKFCSRYPDYTLTDCGKALYSKTSNDRIELTCSNCKQFMGSNIYRCRSNHWLCSDCFGWCDFCNTGSSGVRKSRRLLYNNFLLLPCKWCGIMCTPDNLRDHELSCDENNSKCPLCHRLINVKNLREHLKYKHQCIFLEGDYLSAILLNTDLLRQACYCLVCNKIFKIKCIWRYLIDSDNEEIRLEITTCHDMTGLELLVIQERTSFKLINDELVFTSNAPLKFHLKYLQ